MSKERRRRREARDAVSPATTVGRQTPSRPVPPRRSTPPVRERVGRTVLSRLDRRTRRRRATGPLAAQRRSQNLVLAAGLALANVLLWTQVDGWLARLVAAVVTVALWPVIVTVVFDRRSS